jgi:hypothetical protein
MSVYGVKCEELAKQIAQLVSDADAAGIADVDILEALQTMQDDFGEKQMRAEIERTTTRFEARIVSAIQEKGWDCVQSTRGLWQ